VHQTITPAWLATVLQEAAGARYTAKTSTPRWGEPRVEIELDRGRGIRYLFLKSDDDEQRGPLVSVDAQPGNTLGQAKKLYRHLDDRRDALLKLASSPGWSVAPDFHFVDSFGKVLPGAETPDTLVHYVDFWRTHIDIGNYGRCDPEEWPAILKRLADAQIVPERYPARFASELGGRGGLSAAPGLQISHDWSASDARQLEREGRLAREVRNAIDRLLHAIGEGLDRVG
jgi:hypothetical protein